MATETVVQDKREQSTAATLQAKGYAVHRCDLLTSDQATIWMVHRGASMKFFNSLDSLAVYARECTPWVPRSGRCVDDLTMMEVANG